MHLAIDVGIVTLMFIMFIIQVATDQTNWYYVAQFVPVIVGALALWNIRETRKSKAVSDRNECTLKIVLEKFEDEMKRNKLTAETVTAFKAQLDALVAVAPVVSTALSQTPPQEKE